jgi:hypothetical protein
MDYNAETEYKDETGELWGRSYFSVLLMVLLIRVEKEFSTIK